MAMLAGHKLLGTKSSFSFTSTRSLWAWLNIVWNRIDRSRVKEVGPDRAAAEWLLRCGAAVKWKGIDHWHTDYNTLPGGGFKKYKIEEIDATDSCIMYVGFAHLEGLKDVRKMKLHKAHYIDDHALSLLKYIRDSLEHLEVVSCGNVTDEGVKSLHTLHQLKYLFLCDLIGVSDREGCLQFLKSSLPSCDVHFPPVKEKNI